MNLTITVASDVHNRDGIGIEVYDKEELILEIFRDDSKKVRAVTAYQEEIPLEVIEWAIEEFKKRID